MDSAHHCEHFPRFLGLQGHQGRKYEFFPYKLKNTQNREKGEKHEKFFSKFQKSRFGPGDQLFSAAMAIVFVGVSGKIIHQCTHASFEVKTGVEIFEIWLGKGVLYMPNFGGTPPTSRPERVNFPTTHEFFDNFPGLSKQNTPRFCIQNVLIVCVQSYNNFRRKKSRNFTIFHLFLEFVKLPSKICKT